MPRAFARRSRVYARGAPDHTAVRKQDARRAQPSLRRPSESRRPLKTAYGRCLLWVIRVISGIWSARPVNLQLRNMVRCAGTVARAKYALFPRRSARSAPTHSGHSASRTCLTRVDLRGHHRVVVPRELVRFSPCGFVEARDGIRESETSHIIPAIWPCAVPPRGGQRFPVWRGGSISANSRS